MEKEIIELLIDILQLDEELEIDASRNLKRYGFNSINLVNAVIAIEQKYDIEIRDEDLLPENFSTANAISKLVERYLDEKNYKEH